MKAKEIYNKIEFWIVTIIAASFLLSLLIMSKTPEVYDSHRFEQYHIKYDFWKHLFLPRLSQIIIYYCGYTLINRFVDEKKGSWTKAGSVFGLYLIIATLVSVTYTYTDAWIFGKYDFNTRYIYTFTDAFTTVAIIFLIYIAYYILKELVFTLIKEKKSSPESRKKFFSVFLAIACWIAVLIIFGANHSPEGIAVFGIGVPYIALLVWLHLRYLIPLDSACR
ncbi:MAG: hypothetical protein QM640_05865 [Niabella sp.]